MHRIQRSLAVTAGLAALVTPTLSVAPAQAAYVKPTIATIPDVNINLGMTRRVPVQATNATSYEWRIWTAAKGWTLLAKGGPAYSNINFTGEAVRHMGAIQVTAVNGTQRTVSNLARLRVWGINPSYPAAVGSWVRTGGWDISMGASAQASDGYTSGLQAKMTVRKLGTPAARPWLATDVAYRTTANIERDVWPIACSDKVTPDYEQVGSLAAGQSGAGHLCSPGTTATVAKGGTWVVDAYPSETSYTAGPVAYFRGA